MSRSFLRRISTWGRDTWGEKKDGLNSWDKGIYCKQRMLVRPRRQSLQVLGAIVYYRQIIAANDCVVEDRRLLRSIQGWRCKHLYTASIGAPYMEAAELCPYVQLHLSTTTLGSCGLNWASWCRVFSLAQRTLMTYSTAHRRVLMEMEITRRSCWSQIACIRFCSCSLLKWAFHSHCEYLFLPPPPPANTSPRYPSTSFSCKSRAYSISVRVMHQKMELLPRQNWPGKHSRAQEHCGSVVVFACLIGLYLCRFSGLSYCADWSRMWHQNFPKRYRPVMIIGYTESALGYNPLRLYSSVPWPTSSCVSFSATYMCNMLCRKNPHTV